MLLVIFMHHPIINVCASAFAMAGNASDNVYESYVHGDIVDILIFQSMYYELGPDDLPYAAKFNDCCGVEEPNASGCTTSFHTFFQSKDFSSRSRKLDLALKFIKALKARQVQGGHCSVVADQAIQWRQRFRKNAAECVLQWALSNLSGYMLASTMYAVCCTGGMLLQGSET